MAARSQQLHAERRDTTEQLPRDAKTNVYY